MTLRHGKVCGLDCDHYGAARDGVRARVGDRKGGSGGVRARLELSARHGAGWDVIVEEGIMAVRHGMVYGLDWDHDGPARDGVRARVRNTGAELTSSKLARFLPSGQSLRSISPGVCCKFVLSQVGW
jgi:hypothetical protein